MHEDELCCYTMQVGSKVPEFSLETFEPAKGDFGTFSLKDQIGKKRWTVLVYYPADFTFV